jgi:hypothetical protein
MKKHADDSDVSLGDLVTALAALNPEDAGTTEAIARLLGVSGASAVQAVAPKPRPLPPPRPPVRPLSPPPTGTTPSTPPAVIRQHIPSTLRKRVSSNRESRVTLVPRTLEASNREENEPAPPHEPLLAPNWARAIVSLALSTPAETGPIDVEAVIRRVARLEPVVELPRRPMLSIRLGVQLLLDRGDGMVPFAQDVDDLAVEIVRVAGLERTAILAFSGTPGRSPYDVRRDDTVLYAPPPPRVPVLLVTDFGIARDELSTDRATTREWVEWMDEVRHAGCPIVAFVPYPRHRWPEAIAARATILQWDRTTSAGRLSTSMRAAWRSLER